MMLQHQRRRIICETAHVTRPARVGVRLGLFVVLHANLQAAGPQRDPRAGGIRPVPWPRDFGRWADIAWRTETLLFLGFPRRAKVTDDTKMARRFLRKLREKK